MLKLEKHVYIHELKRDMFVIKYKRRSLLQNNTFLTMQEVNLNNTVLPV